MLRLTRILVFIDESGMTNPENVVFTVGSVWCCPSTTKGSQNTLRYSIDELRRTVQSHKGILPPEIHHCERLGVISKELLDVVIVASQEDHSILRGQNTILNAPICWRITDYSPMIEHHMSNGGEPCGNLIRARAIISCLRPVLNYQGDCKIEVGVILDSKNWKKPVALCKTKIEEMIPENVTNITYEFEDSSRIPGLQIADLITGVTRQYYINQNEKEAYDIIKQHSFDHIIPREKYRQEKIQK